MEKLIIKKTPTFNIKQTLDCGQVFRYREEDGKFVLFAGKERAEITELGDEYSIVCTDAAFFQKYLDFDTNYDIIQLKSQDKGIVSSAIDFGKGIHILKQSPEETVFSFLISQNNHIPRIKAIIERLSSALGSDMGGYHAFPTVSALASKDEDWYKAQGAGYRASYLSDTAKALDGVDLNAWRSLPTDELRQKLISLKGVGRKVADCVLLFGFSRYDVFPVDTWILKAFEEEYPSVSADNLSKILVEKYGDRAGFVQQWMYYFKREQKKV